MRWPQTWAVVLGICLLWILLGARIVPTARQHDFLNLYTGASVALSGDVRQLHVPDAQLSRERQFVPGITSLVPFVRPTFYALLLAPLALLPFSVAFWAWLALQSTILFRCWMWGLRRWGQDALLFGAIFLPVALGIASGQDCVFMLAIVIGTYSLAESGSDFAGGAVLGLGLIKFHLFALWPLALVLQKRWRMLMGASAVGTAELLISLLLSGPSGLSSYVALLQNKDIERLSPSPDLMINVHSLALNLGTRSIAVRGALVIAVILLVAIACWKAPLWRCVAAASAGSLLVSPHVYGYDAALLLVSLWLALFLSGQKWTKMAAISLLTPLPFLVTLAGPPWGSVTPTLLLVFLLSLGRKGPILTQEKCPS